MESKYLSTSELPFCIGCGHHLVARNTEKALETIGLNPLDVILVTDIGCHGIIDRKFHTHTVHGLHGRSVALAAGITLGLNNPSKKVIVYIGDGGATIGLQHLIEAAHRNFDMTVIIHNNMLYGMTGGQASGLTPCGFKTTTSPEGKPYSGYDLCRKANNVGASYARRIIGTGDYSGHLAEAFETEGFSLLEVMEICPSYGVKFNPDRKLTEIIEQADLKVKLYSNQIRKRYQVHLRDNPISLFKEKNEIEIEFHSELKDTFSLILSGSAGGGVQLATELFAQAAIASGLDVSKKGNYPVTVGTGFSSSDIIVSPDPILFTGVKDPDVVIIVSKDGLEHCRAVIERMKNGLLIIDENIDTPITGAEVLKHDFHGIAGARSAALYALFFYLHRNPVIPVDALVSALGKSGISDKVDLDMLLNFKIE